jgi:hypothetical protein
MTDSLFTTQTPVNENAADAGSSYSLGTLVVPSANGSVTGIRWRFPNTLPSGAVSVALFAYVDESTGTLLGSGTFTSPVAGTWNTAATTPVSASAGQVLVAQIWTPDRYVVSGGFFTGTPLVSPGGYLAAPADSGSGHNGRFHDGASPVYPDGSFNGSCYFVDVVFEPSAGHVVSFGQSTETDTAAHMAGAKARGIGQAAEADTGSALRPVKVVALGQASEADTAQPFTGAKARTLGQAAEADTAAPVSPGTPQLVPIGQAIETDTAQPLLFLGEHVTYYSGPCQPWDPIWPNNVPTTTADRTDAAVQAASEVLWTMTGMRFGACPITIRPCRDDCRDVYGPYWAGGWSGAGWWQWGAGPMPVLYQGVWSLWPCGTCTAGCSCAHVSQVNLPSPVASVIEVRIDGAVLDPSAYRCDDFRRLVRVDGGEWPRCNNLSLNEGAVGTWSVTVEVGEQLPELGRLAVGELATEFIKALTGDASCGLPAQVQQITRQGVSMQFLDPSSTFANGRLGLRFCDLFLTTYNPGGLKARPRMYSPDARGGRMAAP